MNQEILNALKWRYAVKVFDPLKKVSEENMQTILESARLAPSSIGIEAWKFLVIENPDLRVKLRAVCYDQSKVTDASHFVVLTYRTDVREHIANELIERASKIQQVEPSSIDGLRKSVEGGIARKDDVALETWVRSQVYIPLGMMIETSALLGVDACPMEGFDNAKVDELLGLAEKNLKSTSMIGFGYRGEDPASTRAKIRREFNDVVEVLK